jgi:hypothetical protein
MRDPEGYREAADWIASATPDQRDRMIRDQKERDSTRHTMERVLESTVPSSGRLHELLLANLTIRPHIHPGDLGLVWMQCQPPRWAEYQPGSCADVAEMLSSREEVDRHG